MEVVGMTSKQRDMNQYYVIANYISSDSNGDKKWIPDENDAGHMVYRVEVWADSLISAINRGIELINQARAETMADYINSNPMYMNQDTFTRKDIKDIYEKQLRLDYFNLG